MHLPWNRSGLRSSIMLVGLCAGQATPASIGIGTPFLLAGIALHLWAKGCLHQGREVTTAGPYRFVRHPFYLGNGCLDLGVALLSGWWLLPVLLPAWWLAVYWPTIHREERVMMARFGDAYLRYRAGVPMLLPWRRPVSDGHHRFSWRNPNIARTEVPRALRFLSYPLLFVIARRLHSDGLAILSSPSLHDALALTGCVALYGSARVWRTHFKQERASLPRWVLGDSSRLALLLAVVAVGACIKTFEMEVEWVIWPPGLVLLGLSMVARTATASQPAISEGLLGVGLALLFEQAWLALLLVPLYVAVILDMRLSTDRATTGATGALAFSAASVGAYSLLLASGIGLSLAKEFNLWG
jgi:hypothetical protein